VSKNGIDSSRGEHCGTHFTSPFLKEKFIKQKYLK